MSIEASDGQAAPAELSPTEALQQVLDAEGAAEAAEPEVAPEPEKVKVADELQKNDKFAAKFAALGRKEKELKARERQMSERMAALEAQYGEKEKTVKSSMVDPDRLKKEPLKVLEEMGFNFQQLAEMAINDGKPTPEMEMDAREAKLMAKLEALEAKLVAKEEGEKKSKEEQVMADFVAGLTSFVNDTPDYELIRANDSVDLVYQVIDEHFNATLDPATGKGQILTNKEAADAVENYLLEEAKKQLKLGKVAKLLQPQVEAKPAQTNTGAKTLSNTQAAQVPQKSSKFLSDDESKRQAASLIRFTED